MPKLWNETIEAHRAAVRDAALDAAAALVARDGLRSVTMSEIAEKTGIGRATLYKYFRDVEAILVAWHDRQISAHLKMLEAIHDPGERLTTVLEAYATAQHKFHSSELMALLHEGKHVAQARRHLTAFVAGLLRDAADAGQVRTDVDPDELATYCLHALNAASSLSSKAAVHRLVTLTMAGLRPNA